MAAIINISNSSQYNFGLYLPSEMPLHGIYTIFCLLQAIALNLYLIGTCALLKLTFHLGCGLSATLPDGHQCWYAGEPMFASCTSANG